MKKTNLIFAALLCFANSAAAAPDKETRMCIKEANANFRQALSDARFEQHLDTATCRFGAVVGACMNTCFADFKTCIQPAISALSDCRKSCADTLAATRLSLQTQLGCTPTCGTNADFQKAMIQARLDFYSCHVTCRKDEGNIAARAACRTVNSACNIACRSEAPTP